MREQKVKEGKEGKGQTKENDREGYEGHLKSFGGCYLDLMEQDRKQSSDTSKSEKYLMWK